MKVLLKGVASGNTLISEAAHFAIQGILHHVASHRLFMRIMAEISHKNRNVRSKIAQYVGVAVQVFPEQIVRSLETEIANFFKAGVSDAHKATRANAREAFYHWNAKHPEVAKALMETLDSSTIKAMQSEIPARPYCSNLLSVKTPRSQSPFMK